MNSPNSQTIAQLTERYKKLHDKSIRTENDLSHAELQLSKLQEEARMHWGTDDIDQLDKKLQEMKESNEKKLKDYQQHLDEIEAQLKKIEDEDACSGTPSGGRPSDEDFR